MIFLEVEVQKKHKDERFFLSGIVWFFYLFLFLNDLWLKVV